jgi:DNA-binding NarL/FixJ family response regulator
VKKNSNQMVLCYLECGLTIRQVAEKFGVCYSTAYRSIVRSPLVNKDLLEKRKSESISNSLVGRKSKFRKLCSQAVCRIRHMLVNGEIQSRLALMFNVSQSTISAIKMGRVYRKDC